MLIVKTEGRFKRDVKKLSKSGSRDMSKLRTIIEKLEEGESLEREYNPHPLSGNWKDHMECHIEPDWLLIYRIDRKYNELILVRTGSHSDLFG
ncbi:MAG: type II toxin-antitoxin system YafQ family toxin [Candidatus Aminicenantes bacterium]|nr:type II toxin-antitoxin system YafQ family toxin [Candidatus Aminicenantes bacterium]